MRCRVLENLPLNALETTYTTVFLWNAQCHCYFYCFCSTPPPPPPFICLFSLVFGYLLQHRIVCAGLLTGLVIDSGDGVTHVVNYLRSIHS